MASTGPAGASSSFTVNVPRRAVAGQWTSRAASPGTYSRTLRTTVVPRAAPADPSPAVLPESSVAGRAVSIGAGPTSRGRSREIANGRRHHTSPSGPAHRASSRSVPTTPRRAGTPVSRPAAGGSAQTAVPGGSTSRTFTG